jgi:transcriptional regulator with XRE-family HTH domain
MDVAELVRTRLTELGYEQQDLADAVHVTPSFISQLLKRKKQLPSPNRTKLYNRIEKFLKLPSGDLSKLADLQRKHELKRKFDYPPRPLFEDVRELVLSKCNRSKQDELSKIFEKEPFGEIERIVTQKLLDVTKEVTREGWNNEKWLQRIARANEKTYDEMRMIVVEFLDTDIYNLSIQNSTYFLDPLIASWDIDLRNFNMDVVLSPKLGESRLRRFAFVEMEPQSPDEDEAGLKDFLRDRSLSTDLSEEEARLLRKLRFKEKKPNALFYYHVLQDLRDPLYFRSNKK